MVHKKVHPFNHPTIQKHPLTTSYLWYTCTGPIQLQIRTMLMKLTVAAVITAVVLVSLTGSHAAPSTSLHLTKRASSDSVMYNASVELLSSMLASHIALVCLCALFILKWYNYIYLWYSNYVFRLKCHPLIQSVYHVLLSFCSTSLVPNTIWTLLSSSGLHPFVLSLLFMTWWQQKRQKTVVQHRSLWIILSLKHANGWVVTPLRTFLKHFLYIHLHACIMACKYVLTMAYVCAIRLSVYWSISAPE